MSTINQLKLNTFRNIAKTELTFSPQFNVFHGNNGAGKTSLLEAIYYLGLGKSFRNTPASRIIQEQQDNFLVLAQLHHQETDNKAAICCSHDHNRQIKLNGEALPSIAPITRIMPIQFMSPMSYRFFHDGPKIRRQYLDWALFHVEPHFLDYWRSFQRVLKQRNSALKQQQSTQPWDSEFAQVATKIDQLRQSIAEKLAPLCFKQLAQLLPNTTFQLKYQRGWPESVDLADVLSNNQNRDRQLRYTYYGPQRADVQLCLQDKPVHDVLSQGQQKLAAYALHLSLGNLLDQEFGTSPLYLIDDLPSELDKDSRHKITVALTNLNAQSFITGITQSDLVTLKDHAKTTMFHVEHGQIHCV